MNDLNPTTKHLPLRIICFCFAFVIAIGAFSYGIGTLVRKKPGWYEIKVSTSNTLPAAASAFSLHYYFTGESNAIRQSKNELETAYTNALSHALKLLDADTLYDGYKNIAYINAHPDENITVAPELYEVLRDAVQRSEEDSYSVFSGAVYGVWTSIVLLEDPLPFDPLQNEESAETLSALSLPVSLNTAAELIFAEEENTVRLAVSAEYASLLNAYEAEEPVLDLNVLRDAYVIRLVSDALAKRGYTGGYYQSTSGITLYRESDTSGVFPLYTENEGTALFSAAAEMKNPTSLCQWLAYPLTEGEYGTYAIEDEQGQIYRRSLYLAKDANPNTVLSGAAVVLYGDDPVEAACAALALFDAETEEEACMTAKKSGEKGIVSIYTTVYEPNIVYVNEQGASCVKALEEGCTVSVLP